MPALLLPVFLGGCVFAGTSPSQQIEIHTILDHREIAGVGCVLANSAGRWFVTTPGRVTVMRARDPLRIDCACEGVGSAREQAPAQIGGLFDTDKLIGNAIVSAGMGNYVNRQVGGDVAYPATLTILMRGSGVRGGEDGDAPQHNVMF